MDARSATNSGEVQLGARPPCPHCGRPQDGPGPSPSPFANAPAPPPGSGSSWSAQQAAQNGAAAGSPTAASAGLLGPGADLSARSPPPSYSGPSGSSAAGGAGAASAPGGPRGGGSLPLTGPGREYVRLAPGLEASCPLLCVGAGNSDDDSGDGAGAPAPLVIERLSYDVIVLVSQAFVEAEMQLRFPDVVTGRDYDVIWVVIPKETSTLITKLEVENISNGTKFGTTIVPADDAARFRRGGPGGSRAAPGWGPEALARDPEIFLQALSPGRPGEIFHVRYSYVQPLDFDGASGLYSLRLPAKLPAQCLAQGAKINDVLSVTATICTLAPEGTEVGARVASKHGGAVEEEPDAREATVKLSSKKEWPNDDVIITYRPRRDAILTTLHVFGEGGDADGAPDGASGGGGGPPGGGGRQNGASGAGAAPEAAPGAGAGAGAGGEWRPFCLTVTPPGPESGGQRFRRAVVFLVDRSASMAGGALDAAKEALAEAVRLLAEGDVFTVCVFGGGGGGGSPGARPDVWFVPEGAAAAGGGPPEVMPPATPANKDRCASQILEFEPGGGECELLGPLKAAFGVLQSGDNAVNRLPIVFVITGGHVSGGAAGPGTVEDRAAQREREICRFVEEQHATAERAPRMCTLGVGPQCNHYFLRRLADAGNGASDFAPRPQSVRSKVLAMVAAVSSPLLSCVSVEPLGGGNGNGGGVGSRGIESGGGGSGGGGDESGSGGGGDGGPEAPRFPGPLPDIFCGRPALLLGRSRGAVGQLLLRGDLPNGQEYAIESSPPLRAADRLPIAWLASKAWLDAAVAEVWMMEGDTPERRAKIEAIQELSVGKGILTPYTSMVGAEMTKATAEKFSMLSPKARARKIARYALGGAAGVTLVAAAGAGLAFGALAAAAVAHMAAGGHMGGGGDITDLMMSFHGDHGHGACCDGACHECCLDCHTCCCHVQ